MAVKDATFIGSPEEFSKVFLQGGGYSSDLTPGGGLNEEQQTEVFSYIRNYAVLLADALSDINKFPANSPIGRGAGNAVNFNGSSIGGGATLVPGRAQMMVHRGGAVAGTYDQMYATGTMTRGATENTEQSPAYGRNFLKLGRRRYECIKLQSQWAASTEMLTRSIRNGALNNEIAAHLSPLLAQDYEDLALNGDIALVDDGSDRWDLLSLNDGWRKLARTQGTVISAQGAYLEHAMFEMMIKSIPAELSAADFKWFINDHVWYDYLNLLSRRGAGAVEASAALGGIGLAPMGIPFVRVPLIPRDLAISVYEDATPARVKGTIGGPFKFLPTALAINLNIDTLGVVTVTFPAVNNSVTDNRLVTTAHACNIINTALAAANGVQYARVARVGQHGELELLSPTVGAASAITIAAPANSALAILGLTAATTAGEAADQAGAGNNTVYEGTEIMLTPAWNFVWHVNVADPGSQGYGYRMFSRFVQEQDQVRTDIFTWQDATLMSPQAMFMLNDLRVARAGNVPVNL